MQQTFNKLPSVISGREKISNMQKKKKKNDNKRTKNVAATFRR